MLPIVYVYVDFLAFHVKNVHNFKKYAIKNKDIQIISKNIDLSINKSNLEEKIAMRKKIAEKVVIIAKNAAYKVVGKSFPSCVYEVVPPKELIHKKRNKK